MKNIRLNTAQENDALNRIRKLFYPRDLDDSRKELVPVYNKAGALHSLQLGTSTYVSEIAYNARGQRILMSMNNGMMTWYVYNSETFRLARTRAEKTVFRDLRILPPVVHSRTSLMLMTWKAPSLP